MLAGVTRTEIPDTIVELARARQRAREARDWREADRLRAEIEGAGWRIVDRGTEFSLRPVHPPDVVVDGRVRYGTSRSVPSRLDEPPIGLTGVVIVATDRPNELARSLDGLRRFAPAGTDVVIIANAPSDDQAAALVGLDAPDPPGIGGSTLEIVRLSARLGQAAALDAGIRRVKAPVVLLLEAGVEPTDDIVSPLVHALDDPSIALAGGWGTVTRDLRHVTEAPPGDVDAVDGSCLAFRRSDYVARGPLDERFRSGRHLDTWWSLVLRDEGEGRPARRAVRVTGFPAVRQEPPTEPPPGGGKRDRDERRAFYRMFDQFGRRRDLISGEPR